MSHAEPRIGIVVVAYNAAKTLLSTLDRIPADFRSKISEIIVSDDASCDDTFELGNRWAARPDSPKTHVIRHTKNLGYGGNQKAAYSLAIAHGLDIVVLLHGDGQYAPESLPEMVAPFADNTPAAVFGSRMMHRSSAKEGGMPLYKRLGNRTLTKFENWVLGSHLTEFHSGYRAYTTQILREIPFNANSDGFDFDTQIIAQIMHAGGEIVEIPIPTYYGDEICYVNGMKYARDVVKDVLEYKLAVRGFGTAAWVPKPVEYDFKEAAGSSHAVILQMLASHPRSKVLDVGCSGGLLAERMRAAGHYVVGVDTSEIVGVRGRTDEFHLADLNRGLPPGLDSDFDVIIAGDIIEHLVNPREALDQMRRHLRPGGELFVSVPNFGHWYPRGRVLVGAFGYDRRGILDETHLHFFTRATLRRLVRAAEFDVLEERATGLPLAASGGGATSVIRRLDERLVRLTPTLFGYQHILRLTPHAQDVVRLEEVNPHVSPERQGHVSLI